MNRVMNDKREVSSGWTAKIRLFFQNGEGQLLPFETRRANDFFFTNP
ncbi:MAG: hypothetical protein ACE5FF_05240 [Saprospiraceae bacterium]